MSRAKTRHMILQWQLDNANVSGFHISCVVIIRCIAEAKLGTWKSLCNVIRNFVLTEFCVNELPLYIELWSNLIKSTSFSSSFLHSLIDVSKSALPV